MAQRIGSCALLLAVLCTTPAARAYEPSRANETGVELGLVYIGSTACGFCRASELKDAVLRVKEILAQRARDSGMSFSATGAAMDWSVTDGVAFLEDVGPFDQIVVGRQKYNLAVLEFVARDAGALIGVPQIVVYRQELRVTPTRVVAGRPVLVRRVMGTAIVPWVKSGAPLEE